MQCFRHPTPKAPWPEAKPLMVGGPSAKLCKRWGRFEKSKVPRGNL